MATFTTRQAAKKLGIDPGTLSRYVSSKKIPEPKVVQIGNFRVHSWTGADIEGVRMLLPKIANGRKTRYQKKQSAAGNQLSVKNKRSQAGAPALRKKKQPKKKKSKP